MADVDLALVFTPDAWVEELHRYLADHGGARVRHLVVDPSMARTESFAALVVSWRWPALTPGFVGELHELGRMVIGVADRDERGARDVLAACNVDCVVDSDAAPTEFLDALLALECTPGAGGSLDARGRHAHGERGEVDARRPHPWIAVCGPSGSGRTEVSIEIARALGAALVDADEVAPALAPRLGLAIEPNLRSAIDAVEFGMGDLDAAVQWSHSVGGAVVCGLTNVASWSQVRPPEVLRVLRALGEAAPVVVDTSSSIDDVGAASRGRYALTRAVVTEADVVVAVGLATPVGIVRLLGWLADAQRLRPGLVAHVVLNRSGTEPFRRAELATELLRAYRPVTLYHLPEDKRVRSAGWAGTVVARGPFTKAVAIAAATILRTARGDGSEAVA